MVEYEHDDPDVPCASFTAPGRSVTLPYTECFACGWPKRDHTTHDEGGEG